MNFLFCHRTKRTARQAPARLTSSYWIANTGLLYAEGMGSNVETTNPRQSRRVAAWIYVVINPIVEGLERELEFLKKGNLTWRSATKRCEYIRTIQEYVDSRQWPNYKDFLSENENAIFLKTFELHDNDLVNVNAAAEEAYRVLLSWTPFSEEVHRLLESYESRRASEPQLPSFNLVRKELVQVAAENVINFVQSLPHHYTYSSFWNYASRDLLTFRNLPHFSHFLEVQTHLLEISSALRGALEDHRLRLSRKYDVPAAPVPGLPIDY